MTATLTAICQHPDCDNEYVPQRWGNQSFCSPECGQDAYRRRNRGESAAIAHDPDRENKPARKHPMTETEFRAELLIERRKLDTQRAHPNDRHWRRAEIARKMADGWTVGQLARFYGIDRVDMQARIREAKGAKP